MKEKGKSQNKQVMLVALALILTAVIGATFAYFTAQIGNGANVDINANTDTVDSLMFEKGKDIEILANQGNFGKDNESITKDTFVKAILTPNSTNNHAIKKYNVFFIIDENDLEYTTEDKQTELLLKITRPDKSEVKEIKGLTYDSTLGGFDITMKANQAFTIAKDYKIEATGNPFTQEWKIEVTLVNLKSNQNDNTGKTFKGSVYITTEDIKTYELYNIRSITPKTTYDSVEATLNIDKGTSEVDKYYFLIEKTEEEPSPAKINLLAIDLEKEYIASDSPTITFTEDWEGNPIEASTNYKIYSYIVDKEGYQSNIYSAVVKTEKYDLVNIDSLVYTKTWNSISITDVNTTPGTGVVKEYSFRSNLTEDWSEYSTSPTYTINDLDENQQVTIFVQVKDSNDKYSTPYQKNITTDAYNYPTITGFNASDITINSMKVKFGVTKGLGEVQKVEVQYDGEGDTWHEANLIGDEYVVDFNELSMGITYNFKIKVTDEFKEKIYEDEAYTGTTQNKHTVSVTVLNGQADAKSKEVVHDGTITFMITATEGYDIKNAKATPEDKCTITEDGTLTVENVTEDISCNVSILKPLNEYIMSLGENSVGNGKLYHHNTELTGGAQDNSYRYAGNNPNNYVCLGNTDSDGKCLNDDGDVGYNNLYRIIGVFPFNKETNEQLVSNNDTIEYQNTIEYRVKLIKSEYITQQELKGTNGTGESATTNLTTDYEYSPRIQNQEGIHVFTINDKPFSSWQGPLTNKYNLWEYGTQKATLNNYLNDDEKGYLQKTMTSWKDKIADTVWHIGGGSSDDLGTFKTSYEIFQIEMTDKGTGKRIAPQLTSSAKIGLMYINDYGYTASKENWAKYISEYNSDDNRQNNWLFNGVYEWTITRLTDDTLKYYNITSMGYIYTGDIKIVHYGVRPVFYLNSNVTLSNAEADGSLAKPYTIG